MTALHSVRTTHQRSALPTVNHTRSVLQKLRAAVDRPMPPAAVVTLSSQAAGDSAGNPRIRPTAEPAEPATQESWDVGEPQESTPPESPPRESASSQGAPESAGKSNVDGLTQDQREMVAELVRRDREVHTHEAAHQAAGGGLVGAASYTYQEGPDGRSYAIGGECPIQIPASDNPSEMIAVAERVRAAALAPANPSGQDMAVANAAVQMEAQARQQLAQREAQQQQAPGGTPSEPAQAPAEPPTQASQIPSEDPGSAAADAGTASRALAAYARTGTRPAEA